MRREERVTVQGPVKKQQPDGMSHRGSCARATHGAVERMGVDGRYNAWRRGAPGPDAHGNAATEGVDDRRAEVRGQRRPSNDPCTHQHSPSTPTTGLRKRGDDTRGRRVTVQGPVKKQQPDGMSHGGGGGGGPWRLRIPLPSVRSGTQKWAPPDGVIGPPRGEA